MKSDFDAADHASPKPVNDPTGSFRGIAATTPAIVAPSALPEFPGHEILGKLGAGGMGVVYRARDISRDSIVALKTLLHFGAADLYRFKQEFRALADLNHANLVMLYQMLSAGEQWCFTMELVDGQDFLSALRPATPPDAPTGAYDPLAVVASAPTSAGLCGGWFDREMLCGDHWVHTKKARPDLRYDLREGVRHARRAIHRGRRRGRSRR